MSRFVVQFAEPNGKTGRETIEADSQRVAVAKVESTGRTPISVQVVGADARPKRPARGRRVERISGGRATRKAVLDFTYQLTAVAESGIPILAGLKAVAEQTANYQLREALDRIAVRIEGGRTLADAIAAEPETFTELFAKTLAAGEAAGKVPEVLAALARYQEQESETAGRIRSAMTYPLLVVISLVLAALIMLIFVVPQFAELFEKFEGKLPMPTRVLLAISDFMIHRYLLVIFGLVGSIFAARFILSYRATRKWLDHHVLRIPVFGQVLVGVYMVRFIELLDLLMQAALPITQSLRVSAESTTNQAIKQDIRNVLRSVEGGRSLTEAFAETRWLTPLVKRMLAIGEQAGRTDQIFAYLRKYYAMQTERSIRLLSTLIEPIMVTGLAALVLFFALSIFLPMWKLLKIVGTA